jgi:UDP-N-acetylglucosamine 2-epimerase
MPEEVNRVLADHVSNLLLCPSQTAVDNLAAEGIAENVHLVGDVMLDVLNWARPRSQQVTEQLLKRFGVTPRSYLLATVHRSENTDSPERLSQILEAFNRVGEPVIFPIHPRARKVLDRSGIRLAGNVHLIDPVGYVDMVALAGAARMILTDSGGLQKEAYWLRVPCVTLRDETEWVETVDAGWNTLTGSTARSIIEAVQSFWPADSHPPLYGDGSSASVCVDLLGRHTPALAAHQSS